VALSRLQALWLIPAALAIHNTEEAIAFPAYLPLVRGRVPPSIESLMAGVDASSLRVALLWATLIPLLILIWVTWRPESRAARWAALVVQTVVVINVVSHVVVATFIMHGYSPGVLSALLINAPLSVYLFRRARREHWLPTVAWRSLVPAALVIHGPGLFALLLLSR
jgi:hypothetical protein